MPQTDESTPRIQYRPRGSRAPRGWICTNVNYWFDLVVAILTRRVIPDSGHSISEIEQSELDLRASVEWASELSRMIRSIESPRPDGTRFGRNKKGRVENGDYG